MEEMLTIKAVAERMHVSERTVYKLVKQGKIEAVRIGKSLRVREGGIAERSAMVATPVQAQSSATLGLQEAPAILDSMAKDIAQMRNIFEAQAGRFREFGIVNVLQPRRMSGSTIGAVQAALHKAYGEVCLMGIALRGFLFQDGVFHDALLNGLKEGRISVRALLLYPFGDAAKARAVAEGSANLRDVAASSCKVGEVNQALYETDLFRNISRSVLTADRLQGEFRDRMKVKLMDMHPTVWMVSTQTIMFIETYHLGKPESDIPGRMIGGCVGEQVPLLAVAPNTNLHTLLQASFDHIWSASNPYLRVKSLADVRAELGKVRSGNL